MQIDDLKEEDIDTCLRIYNYYILHTCFTLEEKPLSLDEFKNRCKSIQTNYPYLVYKDDQNVVCGYAYLSTFNPRSAYHKTADLSIYVDKERVHEHIGGLLLKEIENKAKLYGITNLISIVTSANINSIHFHERNGFILEGELHHVAYKFNTDLSVRYYRKPLL